MTGNGFDWATAFQWVQTASIWAVLGIAWKAAGAWKGMQKDITHICGQVDETNGRVRNHETRISRIEGQHKAEAR